MNRDAQQVARIVRQLAPLLRHRAASRLAAILAVGALAYVLSVPYLNRSMGWNLPGWRELTAGVPAGDATHIPPPSPSTPPNPAHPTKASPPRTRPANVDPGAESASRDDAKPAASSPQSRPPKGSSGSQLADILSGNSRAVYESPAGLRYTRGSQHGHRLLHLMAHAVDEVDRPGSHGVFDRQSADEIVALVDEAYQLARRGIQTETESEAGRQIYTVDLRRRIGYVGGQSGNRSGRPPARRLRLVVDDGVLITAFPVR